MNLNRFWTGVRVILALVVIILVFIKLFPRDLEEENYHNKEEGVVLQVIEKYRTSSTILTNNGTKDVYDYILKVKLNDIDTYEVSCSSKVYDTIEINSYHVFTIFYDVDGSIIRIQLLEGA